LIKRIIKYSIITACGVAVFLVFNHFETVRRGYAAIGGEGAFVLLPLLWWLVEALIKDWRKMQ